MKALTISSLLWYVLAYYLMACITYLLIDRAGEGSAADLLPLLNLLSDVPEPLLFLYL